MRELSDRVALITGAAGNLGRAAVERFREAGARLVLVDRDSDRLRAAFPDLVGSDDHLVAGDTDLTDAEPMVRIAREAFERFGRLDVLFNTVGGFRGGKPLHEEPLETWEQMHALNLRTTLLSCRAVVPYMLRRESGRIVNTAARLGFEAPAGLGAYAASKAGVLRLTESLSEELKGSGVNANCVVPGIIDTPENRAAMPRADFGTWVAPEAIADVAVFLASDAARCVTGAAIPVYGKG